MYSQSDRIFRINDIINKYENELKLINAFLCNPFGLGKTYKELIRSQRLNNYNKLAFNIVVWVLNILLWGILLFGFSSIDILILQVVLFVIVSLISYYIGNLIRSVLFCLKRKKEIEVLISENKKKIKQLEEE